MHQTPDLRSSRSTHHPVSLQARGLPRATILQGLQRNLTSDSVSESFRTVSVGKFPRLAERNCNTSTLHHARSAALPSDRRGTSTPARRKLVIPAHSTSLDLSCSQKLLAVYLTVYTTTPEQRQGPHRWWREDRVGAVHSASMALVLPPIVPCRNPQPTGRWVCLPPSKNWGMKGVTPRSHTRLQSPISPSGPSRDVPATPCLQDLSHLATLFGRLTPSVEAPLTRSLECPNQLGGEHVPPSRLKKLKSPPTDGWSLASSGFS